MFKKCKKKNEKKSEHRPRDSVQQVTAFAIQALGTGFRFQHPHIKNQIHVCLYLQCCGGERRTTGDCQNQLDPRFSERPCLEGRSGELQSRILDAFFWSPGAHARTHTQSTYTKYTYTTLIYIYTHTKISKYNLFLKVSEFYLSSFFRTYCHVMTLVFKITFQPIGLCQV